MVQYALDDVTDDMILAESIFLPSGELLLAAGYRLKSRYRQRLKQLGYNTVAIEVKGTEKIQPEQIISDHLQRELTHAVNVSSQTMLEIIRIRKDGTQTIQQIIRENKQRLNSFLHKSGLLQHIETLIDQVLSQPSVVLNMIKLQENQQSLFTHAIAVTITALCLGRVFRFSRDEMKQLAVGAMNYDLGLVAIPAEILKKNGAFTPEEFEIYKRHTVYGYLMLSQNPAIAATSAAIALQHHENQDGKGFPRGLKGENLLPEKDFLRKNIIHRFAEIVTVADEYNMMTTGRMCQKVHAKDAIKVLVEKSGKVFNREIVKRLVSIVPIFPVGSRIRVSKSNDPRQVGLIGVVAKDNPGNLERPQIILYEDQKRKRLTPLLIDLRMTPEIHIELIS
ncbi:MAG: HD-GYP domain-containing protein [Fibrobacterota bacterium]